MKHKQDYEFVSIEKKWQQEWNLQESFLFDKNSQKPKYYVLEMLPYPSGNLHMGHIRNYTIGDVMARFKKMQGFNVIHPMGWDAFGLPAENAATEGGIHPEIWTKENIARMKKQLQKAGFSYDWSMEIATCDPGYYKHEQQMFIDFYNKGLIYQKETEVNWDPVDNTVLANEQVVDGRGWRSGAVVEKRKLKQWFLRISDYAEELLEGLNDLPDWPEKVRLMQQNWIGKSNGAEIYFTELKYGEKITVFTTRPDTLFGASFVAISPDHELAKKLALNNTDIANFIAECKKGGTSEEELATKEKIGINTGLFATLKIEQEIKVPVFIANFVLIGYGTGAIFGCPAHDERDYEFAIKYSLPIKQVVSGHKNIIIETENFVLKYITQEDRKNLINLKEDSEVSKYMDTTFKADDKWFDDYYDRNQRDLLNNGVAMMAVFFKNKDGSLEFAGRSGVFSFYNNTNDRVPKTCNINKNQPFIAEISYVLHKKFWGKGYGTELCKSVIGYTFKKIPNLLQIIGVIDQNNIASQKILEKCGFINYGLQKNEKFGEEVFYCLEKSNFNIKSKNILFTGNGVAINSYFLNGLETEQAKIVMIKCLENSNLGEKKINYRLRDWGVSRQRYWGCPVPMVYCEKCGIVPEKSENLPIKLPMDVEFKVAGNPLDEHPTFVDTKCPKCSSNAKRETDTLDTFFESSWYFLRYVCAQEKTAFHKEHINKFLSVDNYIGGVEHAVMHLLYARFFVKALRDCGYLNFDEPFKALLTQGMVCHRAYQNNQGKWLFPHEVENGIEIATGKPAKDHGVIKMSKSKKNVVDPINILDKYGADTARLFMMSDTPPERDLEWSTEVVESVFKYINRLYKLVQKFVNNPKNTTQNQDLTVATHKAIQDVTNAIQNWQLNKMVSGIREFSNTIEEHIDKSDCEFAIKTLCLLINPVIPHLAEELWSTIGNKSLIANEKWPEFDIKKLEKATIIIAVQINGKMRAKIVTNKDATEEFVRKMALSEDNVVNHIGSLRVEKVIFVANKIINFIVK